MVVKNPPVSVEDAGDMGLIPWLGRYPEEGNGNPLQYCCLENSMDSRACQATVHGVCSDTTEPNNKTNKGKNDIGTIY